MAYLEGLGTIASVEVDEGREREPVAGWYFAAPVMLILMLLILCLVQNGR